MFRILICFIIGITAIVFSQSKVNMPFDYSRHQGYVINEGVMLWNQDWSSGPFFFDGSFENYPSKFGPRIEAEYFSPNIDSTANDSNFVSSYFDYVQGDYFLDNLDIGLKFINKNNKISLNGFKRKYAGAYNQYTAASESISPIQYTYTGTYSAKINNDQITIAIGSFNSDYSLFDTLSNSFVNSDIETKKTSSFFQQFKTAFQIKPFAILLGIKVTQLTGFAVFLASLPYLFTRVMDLSYNYLGFYFLVQGSVMLISQPIWVKIVNKIGKKNGYYLASISWGLGALSWMLVTPGESEMGIIIRGVFLGIGAGGLLLVGQSMLPDTMQYDFQTSGYRREGILAGVYTTVEKLSFAIGPSILGILLGYVDYDALSNSQSESVINMMYFNAGGFPVICLFISCLLITAYNVDQQSLRKNN